MWQLVLYLKLILRGWQRNRLSFVLSLLSLILGLTCSLLSFAFVEHELRIAGSLPVADEVYLLRTVNPMYGDDNVLSDNTGPHLAAELADELPEIADVCVIEKVDGYLKPDSLSDFDFSLYRVSPSFCRLFTRMQVTGNLETTLASPDQVAITRSQAQQWYGGENPLGKQIRFSSSYSDALGNRHKKNEFLEITAVIEDGGRQGYFLPAVLRGRYLSEQEKEGERQGWGGQIISFVMLAPGVDVSHVARKLDAQRVAPFKKRFFLTPAHEIYFGQQHATEYFLSRDRGTVRVAFWVALSMLFVALFNYVNLTMTRTLHRLRNVGQQWVFGATKQSLGLMLLLETTLQVLIGLLLSCLAIRFLLPHFNRMMEAEMKFDFLLDPVLLLVMAALMITLVVLPVLYILWMMSGQKMAEVVKGRGRLRKSGLTRASVIAQFAVSIVLLIVGLNVQRQMRFVAHVRPFSETIYRLSLSPYMEANKSPESFLSALRASSLVEELSFCSPLKTGAMSSSAPKGIRRVRHSVEGDEGYLAMYGLTLLEGRNLLPSDKGTNNVLVNETLINSDSITHPIGATIGSDNKVIVGVVKDVPVEHFSKPIQPLLIRYGKGMSYLYVKTVRPVSVDTLSSMVASASKGVDGGPYKLDSAESVADIYLEMHSPEIRFAKMVALFTLICFVISCLGLFGLAWYAVERRIREVAIRKVHGATVLQVAFLLSGRFLQWILIAFVLALPPAFLFSNRWFSEFVYKVPQSVWVFALGGGAALFIGFATVFWQTIRVALRNPIQAISHE